MVDVSVKSGAAWVCSPGRHLADVLLPVHDGDEELGPSQGDVTNRPVLLQQTEDGSPCVLTVCCSSSAAISRLLVISEARTMELYNQIGEYCGTVRGERDESVQPDNEDRGPFYRKQLILDLPSSACEVKLLSLGGRSSVLVCRVFVGLQRLQPGPVRGPGIDMEQVQCLVEEMGTSLSPGAQNLMEMVHFQQKNQTSSLGGFLPLLMGGGALSLLARGANTSAAAVSNQNQSAESTPPLGFISPADRTPVSETGAMSVGSTSSPDSVLSDINTENSASGDDRSPVNHAHLAEMMSQFLKGQHGQALTSGPDFLPVLQSVCGQVTQLRLDDAAAEEERQRRNGSCTCGLRESQLSLHRAERTAAERELDSAMERRLDEMERRLKEHVDRRLDALEQKLEKALLSALPLVALNQGGMSSSAGGAASSGPEEPSAPTPAVH